MIDQRDADLLLAGHLPILDERQPRAAEACASRSESTEPWRRRQPATPRHRHVRPTGTISPQHSDIPIEFRAHSARQCSSM